jgi:hypothetical protein
MRPFATRPATPPRRADQRRERTWRLRTLQLCEGITGLASNRDRDENGVHTAEFVTPTGSRYRSTAPPLPGVPDIELTELEVRIGFAIAEWDAA